MNEPYQVLTESRKTEKSVHSTFERFSPEQLTSLENILRNDPKGTMSTHWKIKKVKRNIWQCDLPEGYRIAYTVIDKPIKTVVILFAGNHDDAAAFLRSKI